MVSLYPLGLFEFCTAILIYCSRIQQKGSFESCVYGVSSDFLYGMSFISSEPDCTLLFALVAIGCLREMK